MQNTFEPTILLPQLSPSVDSACIMHELRNLGCISHVIVTKCISMTGLLYNRATVHFKYWYENAGTKKPRTSLQSGKTINIIDNKTHLWQAQAFIEDSRPYKLRRLDDAHCDQDVSQGFNDRRLRTRKEDNRPYRERRFDDALCEEDVAQGFNDRRLKLAKDCMKMPICKIAVGIGLEEVKQLKPVVDNKPVDNKPLVRNNCMVARMNHAFNCVITDEIYRNSLQTVYDYMRNAEDICDDEEEETKSKVRYGTNYPVMKRRPRRIIVD